MNVVFQQVTSIISCALEIGSDALVSHLFKECNLLDWLVESPAEVTAMPHPEDNRQAITSI